MRWFVAILLLDARLAIGFTRPEAARAFGCTDSTIYYWERGSGHPRPSEVLEIAETYHLSDKVRLYLRFVLENRDLTRLEADPRLHALVLSKAELHSGVIFKYEPHLIPAPLQHRDYHFFYIKQAEGLSDHDASEGWSFKLGRQVGIEKRKDQPIIQYLIGDSAILALNRVPVDVARAQVKRLIDNEGRPGVEIRVIQDYHPARDTQFDILKSGDSKSAPPVFVYAAAFHGSRCIEEESLIARYDEAGQAMWQLGIPVKEFLYEYCRDLLA